MNIFFYFAIGSTLILASACSPTRMLYSPEDGTFKNAKKAYHLLKFFSVVDKEKQEVKAQESLEKNGKLS